MKRLLLSLILAAPFMSAAYAGGPAVEKPSGWHAYISGYGGGFFENISDDRNATATTGTAIRTGTSTDKSSRAFGGGSIGVYTDLSSLSSDLPNKLAGGFEVSISGINSGVSTRDTYTVTGVAGTYTSNEEFKLRYNVDLAGTLGTMINEYNLYGKVGASYGNFRSKITQGNAASGAFSANRTKGKWGLVAGVGVSRAIANNLSVYAEYDYYYYNKFNIVTTHAFAANTVSINRSIRMRANTFRIGLSVGLNDLHLPGSLSDLSLT